MRWFHVHTGVWGAVQALDFQTMGYAVAGLFAASWIASVAIWRFGKLEGRWGGPWAPLFLDERQRLLHPGARERLERRVGHPGRSRPAVDARREALPGSSASFSVAAVIDPREAGIPGGGPDRPGSPTDRAR